jgi:hypothetical protein
MERGGVGMEEGGVSMERREEISYLGVLLFRAGMGVEVGGGEKCKWCEKEREREGGKGAGKGKNCAHSSHLEVGAPTR